MSRIQARELAFKIIFSYQFNVSDKLNFENEKSFFNKEGSNLQINDVMLNNFLDENSLSLEDDKEFFYDIVNSFTKNINQINQLIEKNVKINKFNSVYKSDMAILQLSVAEMLMKKYDYQIVIYSAVELAKKYSDEKNYKFVHSVLSKIIKEIYSE